MNDACEVHRSAGNWHFVPFEGKADEGKLATKVVLVVVAAGVVAADAEFQLSVVVVAANEWRKWKSPALNSDSGNE